MSSLAQRVDGLKFKKAQYNQFVESELGNWALMSWTTHIYIYIYIYQV